jgi:t-SNARE complex subunit (syntaxin)
VGRNPKGQPESVRYEQVNAMLLNEFLKEHKKVQKLEETVADLAQELQQVKAQVQTNSPILRVAVENR